VEQLRAYIDLGFEHFLFDPGDFPSMTTLETLAHEVLPLLNQ
jgi:hypothetical protein